MGEIIVDMRGISKQFPGVKALDNVSLTLQKGEVMALLGENGAGKSTLMKILSGIIQADSGDILIDGEKIENLSHQVATKKGIAIIHQELNMCPHLTVAENIFLGREIRNKFGKLDAKKMNAETESILDRLGVDITPTDIVGNLSVSKQQMIEIAKAISLNSRILIMDEPTSALTSKEIDNLFTIINQLKKTGVAIVYISHRLEELKFIVDRITIMRDSKFITTGLFTDFSMEDIITNMVGRKITEQFPHVECEPGNVIFEVKNLNVPNHVKNVSFKVREGEILGIAGLMGAGRTETTRAIFGIDKKESGHFFLNGKEIKITCPSDAISNGIVLVPEDRKKDGICVKLPVNDNIALTNLRNICNKLGIIRHKIENNIVNRAIKDFLIKVSTPSTLVQNLSGGNQQKVVIAKWLVGKSKIVIFDEPTRGIDIAAKVEIYNLINELKKQGIGVIIISSEMPEIIGVSDSILVMCEGRITGQLSREEATQEKILVYATQFNKKNINSVNN